ncbi:MAG: hypothetical protein K0Q72_1775 [Armatimonadetes bacterium]|jgi:hypothetical protein|nr:hypothetical protein [Armatimonadota bacterium]
MTADRLAELGARGWRFTRDGSTGTAYLTWEDPDDPEAGWELQVLKTEGHRARFTLEPLESGLTERDEAAAQRLESALQEVLALMRDWNGELLDDE